MPSTYSTRSRLPLIILALSGFCVLCSLLFFAKAERVHAADSLPGNDSGVGALPGNDSGVGVLPGNDSPSGNNNSKGAGKLVNPLKFDSLVGFLVGVIQVLLIFAVPIIVFFIIYAGFLFVTAQGDTGKITTARSALTWAVIGGVIVLGAEVIVQIIKNTVEAF